MSDAEYIKELSLKYDNASDLALERAHEIDRLTAELAAALKERDYWRGEHSTARNDLESARAALAAKHCGDVRKNWKTGDFYCDACGEPWSEPAEATLTQECDQCGAKADAKWTSWQCCRYPFGSCDGKMVPLAVPRAVQKPRTP
jgi:hypothetical protein